MLVTSHQPQSPFFITFTRMGFLRFLLAVFVIASHAKFIGFPFPDKQPYEAWVMFGLTGRQAVGIFFIISGFYMSMVLNSKYTKELSSFYINRFLRLWPTYLVSVLFVVLFLNDFNQLTALLSNSTWLTKLYVWFANIFILGSDFFWLLHINETTGVLSYLPVFLNDSNGYKLFLNQPVFTISIEMIFYLMAPFILKSIKRVWVFFAIGLLYHLYFVMAGQINIIYQYHLLPASFMYFAMGALSWHYYYKHKEYKKLNYFLVIAIFLIMQFTYTLIQPILLIAFMLLIPNLFELTKNNKADRFIGELSYPLYILHFPIRTLFDGFAIQNEYFGLSVLAATLCLSIPVHFLIEKPIDRLRQKLVGGR